MKRFLKVAIPLGIVALILGAWSMRALAASRTPETNRQVASRSASPPADWQARFPASALHSAGTRGSGQLSAVAAVSSKDMWAVGMGFGTLTEHWDGTKWTVVDTLDPGSEYNDLHSVTAVAANDVWAVGDYSSNPQVPDTNSLIEHWNGTKWSLVDSLDPGALSNSLMAVSAVSANDIWAVGNYQSNGSETLIEHFDGTSWSVVSSPSPDDTAVLNGVVAISAKNVWAVGYFFASGSSASKGVSSGGGGGGQQTLIEHWDGTSWSEVSSPNPSTSGNALSAVTAVSASNLWAVGFQQTSSGGQQTLIEHWDGTSWSEVSSPSPGSGSALNGVTAHGGHSVWAVGFQQDSSGERTLIEQWNGSSWRAVSSPNAGPGTNQLYGAIALSASVIWAVGLAVQPNGPPQTLIERWNGTQWSVVGSPNRNGGASLSGVAAISASDVWAVGADASGAITDHWNGTKWTFYANPDQGTFHYLNGVAALSANNVWAVGQYVTSNVTFDTLIEHWNGTKWSIIPSPNTTSEFNNLLGVAVVSANNVWAVGNSDVGQTTLIEHWNGTKWSIIPSPNPGVNGDSLNAVVAVSATDVLAVGYQYNSSFIQQTLVERWNGTKWSVVSSPSPGPTMNVLSGVTAVSATNAWAVGYHDGNNILQTLIEHWNGTKWSVVSSPNAVSGSSLNAISAASASNVWAVGTYGTLFGTYYTLIEHWNGTKWSIVTSANPGSAENMLNGAVDISGSSAWVVGSYSDNNFTSKTLAEKWNGSAWSVIYSPYLTAPPTS